MRRLLSLLVVGTLLVACGGGVTAPTPVADSAAEQTAPAPSSSSAGPVEPTPATISFVPPEPVGDRLLASIQMETWACDVVEAGAFVWVSQWERSTILRIDPTTNAIVDEISMPASPCSMTSVDGSIWIAAAEGSHTVIHRLDPTTGETLVSLPLPFVTEVVDMTGSAEAGVWVLDHLGHQAFPIDPSTNTLGEPVDLQYVSVEMVLAGGAFWITSELRPELARVDLATRAVEFVELPFAGADGITGGTDGVWSHFGFGGRLVSLDATTAELTGDYVIDLTMGDSVAMDGTIWLPSMGGQLVGVDAATGTASRVMVIPPGHGTGYTAFGDLWLGNFLESPSLIRIDVGG